MEGLKDNYSYLVHGSCRVQTEWNLILNTADLNNTRAVEGVGVVGIYELASLSYVEKRASTVKASISFPIDIFRAV